MPVTIHPTYLPSIAHVVAIIKTNTVVFEMHDNFVKQTYRNRAYIYGANDKLALNIPVIHSQKNRKKYRDVKIFNEENWQSQHWKSLLSAYRTSPFFEFYEDDFKALFTLKTNFLLDFNLQCFKVICDCLQLSPTILKTDAYHKVVNDTIDFRCLVHAKNEPDYAFDAYTQVFSSKHGFLPNLSILDLLFNEGPNALHYLERQKLPRL